MTLAPSNPEETGAELNMAGSAETQHLQPSATPPSCTLQQVQRALFLCGVISSPRCPLPWMILAFPPLCEAACTLVPVLFPIIYSMATFETNPRWFPADVAEAAAGNMRKYNHMQI